VNLERRMSMKAYIVALLLGLAVVSGAVVISAVAGEPVGSHPVDFRNGR
jgi:hypothetical protein